MAVQWNRDRQEVDKRCNRANYGCGLLDGEQEPHEMRLQPRLAALQDTGTDRVG
jgi:hypothetical protein